MRIAVIGAGYVGLVAAACLAKVGHEVTCVEKEVAKIAALHALKMPIYEPGLQDVVADAAAAGRLRFTSDMEKAVAGAEVVFLAVGTPARRGDGFADLTFIRQAAREIALALPDSAIVVIKSTVPVGTGDEIARLIEDLRSNAVEVVSNPEFLRQGAALHDFMQPDRVVIGCESARARAIMRDVYRPLVPDSAPLLFTSRRSAELVKYAANCFLATKITFINEIADLCEQVGADVGEVAASVGLDRRIGASFLSAGPGYGGSCFPKDTLALIKTAQDHAVPVRFVETVAALNEQRKRAMARKVVAACGGSVRGRWIGLLGLTFKPDTDDLRDAPSLGLAWGLQDAGARLRAFDPKGLERARPLFDDVDFAEDAYACAEDADALVIVTEWPCFRNLDFERLKRVMRKPVLVDLRNVYEPEQVACAGFRYVSIGRAAMEPTDEAAAWRTAAE